MDQDWFEKILAGERDGELTEGELRELNRVCEETEELRLERVKDRKLGEILNFGGPRRAPRGFSQRVMQRWDEEMKAEQARAEAAAAAAREAAERAAAAEAARKAALEPVSSTPKGSALPPTPIPVARPTVVQPVVPPVKSPSPKPIDPFVEPIRIAARKKEEPAEPRTPWWSAFFGSPMLRFGLGLAVLALFAFQYVLYRSQGPGPDGSAIPGAPEKQIASATPGEEIPPTSVPPQAASPEPAPQTAPQPEPMKAPVERVVAFADSPPAPTEARMTPVIEKVQEEPIPEPTAIPTPEPTPEATPTPEPEAARPAAAEPKAKTPANKPEPREVPERVVASAAASPELPAATTVPAVPTDLIPANDGASPAVEPQDEKSGQPDAMSALEEARKIAARYPIIRIDLAQLSESPKPGAPEANSGGTPSSQGKTALATSGAIQGPDALKGALRDIELELATYGDIRRMPEDPAHPGAERLRAQMTPSKLKAFVGALQKRGFVSEGGAADSLRRGDYTFERGGLDVFESPKADGTEPAIEVELIIQLPQ